MVNEDPSVLQSKQALQGGQAGSQHGAKQPQPCTGWYFTAVPDLLGAGSQGMWALTASDSGNTDKRGETA